ncbi:MAG: hypothetical protein FWG55_10145 [Candidatus Bathyarchaeota archaeon]|nr:hypothetical protein [Candidatus Termiticorpusculum sp.]
MLGKYENFPVNIHFLETFSSTLNSKQLQQKVIQTLKELNRKPFHFEEITIPTIPNSEVIFEFGIAEDECFNFLDDQETNRALNILRSEQILSLDFFCVIRYYKNEPQKRVALKFDYYIFKISFIAKMVEFQIFHKQGPRYIAPEELVTMITDRINKAANKRVLDKNVQENAEF